MCLNCGCDEYQKRHKATDITMDDLAMVAVGRRMQIREAAANLEEGGEQSNGQSTHPRRSRRLSVRSCRAEGVPSQDRLFRLTPVLSARASSPKGTTPTRSFHQRDCRGY
jgi:hypothetical protein